MTRTEKIWATRRERYGPNGGCRTPTKLHWIPADKRGRYDSLRNMHGAEIARQMIAMEMADAAAENR